VIVTSVNCSVSLTKQYATFVIEASKKDLPKVEPNSFRSALSGRLIYGLAEHFGGGLPGPVVIAEEGAYRLGLSYGVGSKSLQLLAKALYDYGYIDDPERWLAGK
jgi:hypothetical protein